MMLLALLAFGVGMGFARKAGGTSQLQTDIEKLKVEVSKPNVRWETWLQYGKALQSAQRFSDAAVAYEQVLKVDPYQEVAREQCSICRAKLGDKEILRKFMQDTVEVNPKLAKAIFEKPYMASFLSDTAFKKLNQDAIAGSMD
jgi:hypothetical protein